MTDVVMPQMGESIVEGTLTKWLKKAGERVERDEPLFEISTDKVDTEIPSPAAGTLAEVLVEEGKTVQDQHRSRAHRRRRRRAPSKPPPPQAGSDGRGPPPPAAAGPRCRASPCRRRPPRRPGRARPRRKPPDRFRRWCAGWRARTISISPR